MIPPADDRQPDTYAQICAHYTGKCADEAGRDFERGNWDAARSWAAAADYWARELARSLRSPSTETPDND